MAATIFKSFIIAEDYNEVIEELANDFEELEEVSVDKESITCVF